MLKIPGLGPKKIAALRKELAVTSIAELEKACKEGRVAALAGFGEKTQEKILAGIRNREAYSRRHLWWDASEAAAPILAGLRALPQVSRAETAGSLRRGLETVGDLDFIVAAADVAPVVNWFTGHGGRAGGHRQGRDQGERAPRGRTPGRPPDHSRRSSLPSRFTTSRVRRTTTCRCASAPSTGGSA